MEPTRISVDEAMAMLDSESGVVFLDTRAANAWNASNAQIPGSLRVDPHEVEQHLGEIPRGRPIVTYCT